MADVGDAAVDTADDTKSEGELEHGTLRTLKCTVHKSISDLSILIAWVHLLPCNWNHAKL